MLCLFKTSLNMSPDVQITVNLMYADKLYADSFIYFVYDMKVYISFTKKGIQ